MFGTDPFLSSAYSFFREDTFVLVPAMVKKCGTIKVVYKTSVFRQ